MPPALKIPEHVAVIMDGNGRWAKERGLPRTDGHSAGEEALMRWVREGVNLGVKEMSFYTFSTENWNRAPSEVKFLMQISKRIMRERADEFIELGVRIRWVGRKTRLWKSVLKELDIIEEKTSHCSNMVVNFCINYGGRSEIVDAVNAILEEKLDGRAGESIVGEKRAKISEASFKCHLYSPQMRDVDLLIRTSGELRLSNFLLWQLAYAEMVFVDDYWPDTSGETLVQGIKEYTKRDRRFGKA
ncbi:MAG: di-trans,poly-cis-decaprenylcistransferase [Candidatus Ancillula sp.]|jgi:undecaprenyl diphosphate synthase|nr:di-trans,poly-cis-decaprenylcistransferase [Candidatus Ancillula sp.]